ncbi:MAG: RHS repeat-associated core domain-containing protein [Lachnospiraceae bacterium]|nr:RHS repeat-associated core domain-containing protein [Lachnospiraceae bacterium]
MKINEAGLYYLQSRYYDPEVGRFINADSMVSTQQGILSENIFAYCENDPVNRVDPEG